MSRPFSSRDEDVVDAEVVDDRIVGGEEVELVAEVRPVEKFRQLPSAPVVAAAAGATGFLVGTAALALVRHQQKSSAVRRARRTRLNDLGNIVGTRTFL